MAVGSLLSIGTQGVQAGMRRANEAAQDIVRVTTGSPDKGGDLVTPLVDLKVSEHLVAASAKVIKSADETLGTLIDTLA